MLGICSTELRLLVVRPTLRYLRAWSQGRENLLLGTAAQESQLGFHLKQGRRHGMGIFQIQPHIHRQIWDAYLINQPALASKIRGLASQRDFLHHPHTELATNLRYATAIAWLIYRAAGVDKIATGDIATLARLWYHHFHRGPSARIEDFKRNYRRLVGPDSDSGTNPAQAANKKQPLKAPDCAPQYTAEHIAELPAAAEHPVAAPRNPPAAPLSGRLRPPA